MQRSLRLWLALNLWLSAPMAFAWTRPGHMVTAAIAYEHLRLQDARTAAEIAALLSKHPDRAPFEAAIGKTTGDERTQRIFMQMARWPDDIRGSIFDHPTWHYAARPLVDARNPPPTPVPDRLSGAAQEAYALNLRIAADRNAPPGERALALCWIFHIVGDMHQPLHAVDQFSARFPQGDRGGGLQFVRESENDDPESLHSYWDGIVGGSGEATAVSNQARTLMAKYPRAAFPQLTQPAKAGMAEWARESAEIAEKFVYRNDLATGETSLDAKPLSAAYAIESKTIGERQLVLSGYRLVDTLRSLFP